MHGREYTTRILDTREVVIHAEDMDILEVEPPGLTASHSFCLPLSLSRSVLVLQLMTL